MLNVCMFHICSCQMWLYYTYIIKLGGGGGGGVRACVHACECACILRKGGSVHIVVSKNF